MSGMLTFFVALLGAAVGGLLALMIYGLCVVAGDADDYVEGYWAGVQAAQEREEA